ncbi:hypothetical protein B0H13DRAFT_1890380 [Mycena leptocephala]|nr:hypothetical protein B0H13DRAFT_1890380 [Mycena leptocephala]
MEVMWGSSKSPADLAAWGRYEGEDKLDNYACLGGSRHRNLNGQINSLGSSSAFAAYELFMRFSCFETARDTVADLAFEVDTRGQMCLQWYGGSGRRYEDHLEERWNASSFANVATSASKGKRRQEDESMVTRGEADGFGRGGREGLLSVGGERRACKGWSMGWGVKG